MKIYSLSAKFKKPLLILFTLCLIILLMSVYFSFSNKNKQISKGNITPNSAGQSYTNNIFSVQIPQNWTVSEDTDKSGKKILNFRNPEGKNYIVVYELKPDEINRLINYVTYNPQKDFEHKVITIDGETAQQYYGYYSYYGCTGVQGCGYMYYTIVTHKNKTYQISFGANLDIPTNVYKNFVSTMRFK